MPVPFAPLFAFVAGVAFAWLGRRELVQRDGVLAGSRLLAAAALYGALAVFPTAAYFAAFHGDWAYLYVVPSRRVPSAVDLGLALLAGACVPLGAALAAPFARAHQVAVVRILAFVPLAALFGGLAVFARRLAVSATFSQYHGRFGVEPILTSVLGRGVPIAAVLLAAAAAVVARELGR